MKAFFRTAIIFTVLALTISNEQTARAGLTLYVSPAGDNNPDCGVYQTNPCKTIQFAINKLGSGGGTLMLAQATFSSWINGEVFPITIAAPVTIIGGGRTNTFIDATGTGQNVINVSSGYNLTFAISGVTIKGGNRGIQLSGGQGYFFIGAQITDNDISNNVIGIYASYTTGSISRNNFSGNTSYGIYNDHATETITRNAFAWNCTGGISSYDAAIYHNYSSSRVENNLIGWNNGSGIYVSHSNPTIVNNTISVNYGGSGIAVFNASSPNIVNNIITSNGYYGIHADFLGSWGNTYNDVWANASDDYYGASVGTGSISKDPKLVSGFDVHPLCSSPVINAGNNTDAPAEDYDGNPRPVGGGVDMGAYEKQTDLFCPIYLPLILK